MNPDTWVLLLLRGNYQFVHDLVVLCCCYLPSHCAFFLFTIVCMALNVLSAVKKENTIMVENVNHVTVPVPHVQVSHWQLSALFSFLYDFSSDFILLYL